MATGGRSPRGSAGGGLELKAMAETHPGWRFVGCYLSYMTLHTFTEASRALQCFASGDTGPQMSTTTYRGVRSLAARAWRRITYHSVAGVTASIGGGTKDRKLPPFSPAVLSLYVAKVWELCLARYPEPEELERSVAALSYGVDPMTFLLTTASSSEATSKRAERQAVPIAYPLGHYYSPIVDPAALADSGFKSRQIADAVPGVEIDYTKMTSLIRSALHGWNGIFPETITSGRRYYVNNDMYGIGDAIILSAMLRHFRPKQWIEIGCGFSSAILLDTLDDDRTLDTTVTFIEPNTERLESLLRDIDRHRLLIIKNFAQEVPLETFDKLCAGDVLFLDTTHISKTGSDVNHEIFLILPRLASGVIVHFHDVFDQFEYPDDWIYAENRSWNELYVLRAFLMYNGNFEILYANDSFAKHRKEVIAELRPEILRNPGGGLWLIKR
jgi:hypothetical protein